MSPPDDWITFFCTGGFFVVSVFTLSISVFGLVRTGLWFFYVTTASGILGCTLAACTAALYYNPPALPRMLGRQLYSIFFYAYTYVMLANAVLFAIAWCFVVRWVVISARGPNQAMQRTAGRSAL